MSKSASAVPSMLTIRPPSMSTPGLRVAGAVESGKAVLGILDGEPVEPQRSFIPIGEALPAIGAAMRLRADVFGHRHLRRPVCRRCAAPDRKTPLPSGLSAYTRPAIAGLTASRPALTGQRPFALRQRLRRAIICALRTVCCWGQHGSGRACIIVRIAWCPERPGGAGSGCGRPGRFHSNARRRRRRDFRRVRHRA